VRDRRSVGYERVLVQYQYLKNQECIDSGLIVRYFD
jgi:hypothetical protein